MVNVNSASALCCFSITRRLSVFDYSSFVSCLELIQFQFPRLLSMSVFDFIHLLHGARGGESQTNRMCMQVLVSMSVLSVFVLSAFVCLFTALIVQIIR